MTLRSALALPSIQQRHAPRIAAMQAELLRPMVAAKRQAARAVSVIRPSPMPTPEQCGAKGNGADDSIPLQAWLDLAGPLSLPAQYMHRKMLYASSGTYVQGWGIGGLYNPEGGVAQLTHRNYVFPGDSNCIDQDITFDGVDFSGDPKALVPPNVTKLGFIGVRNLTFLRCRFRASRRYLLVVSNLFDATIDGCIFEDFGVAEPYTGPPGEWFAGVAMFCYGPCFGMRFTKNKVRTGTGIGGWFDGGGRGLDLSGSSFENVAEAALVGFPPGTIANGVTIDGVTRPGISGHGIEAQAGDWSFVGGRITNVAGACIFGTDLQRVVIADNLLGGANQQPQVMTAPIIIRTATADPGQTTADTTIANNTLYATNGHGARAITLANWSGNDKALMRSLSIVGNNTGDPAQWREGDPLLIVPAPKPDGKSRVLGPNCRVAV